MDDEVDACCSWFFNPDIDVLDSVKCLRVRVFIHLVDGIQHLVRYLTRSPLSFGGSEPKILPLLSEFISCDRVIDRDIIDARQVNVSELLSLNQLLVLIVLSSLILSLGQELESFNLLHTTESCFICQLVLLLSLGRAVGGEPF